MTVVTSLKNSVVAPPAQLQNCVSWIFSESEASQERRSREVAGDRVSPVSNRAATWIVSSCTVLVLLILVTTVTYLPSSWIGTEENETEASQMIMQLKPDKSLKRHPNPPTSSGLCLRHCGEGIVYAACSCKDRCDCAKAIKFLKNNLTSREMCYVFCMPSGHVLSSSCKDFNPDICLDFVLTT